MNLGFCHACKDQTRHKHSLTYRQRSLLSCYCDWKVNNVSEVVQTVCLHLGTERIELPGLVNGLISLTQKKFVNRLPKEPTFIWKIYIFAFTYICLLILIATYV